MAPETLYLEDDFTRVARFPSEVTGGFDSTFWHDRVTMQVMGESLPNAGDDSVTLPSPQQLGVCRPGTSTNQTVKPQKSYAQLNSTFGKPKEKSAFKRVVFLAHFDSDTELVKSHTAHLKLKKEDCNVHDVSRLVKDYLNLDEDLVIVDVHGYEIMDGESTRGKLQLPIATSY